MWCCVWVQLENLSGLTFIKSHVSLQDFHIFCTIFCHFTFRILTIFTRFSPLLQDFSVITLSRFSHHLIMKILHNFARFLSFLQDFLFISQTRIEIFFFLCRNRIRMYPAFVNCTTIDWFSEWPLDALLEVADKYLSDISLGSEEEVSFNKLVFLYVLTLRWFWKNTFFPPKSLFSSFYVFLPKLMKNSCLLITRVIINLLYFL